ncbi:polyphenol oxidase E, chloroplastic-like [Solanum stenotomum]|uniref:polyphenol oxidase E, chloroplastic-like n=1 Tax=Solanum stenotomum TaxID=172797 RepID=UPI0020D10E43|nr:polyphenol oxidase E, chloroplastic-like [Solanum stenotomum]
MASSFSINSICLSLDDQSSKTLTTTTLSSFFAKPYSPRLLKRRRSQSFHVSCNANEHDQNIKANIDRRNVLLGLGGLYSASNLAPLAFASPIPPPDLKSCSKATKTGSKDLVEYSCCPPTPKDLNNIPYYNLPPMSKLRKRPVAQDVTKEYIAKYQLATKRMKELDKDDPRSFMQQANIHCAYCNGAYKFGDEVLQVHQSWLFFPFHRWYLYFYERILGKLINDPTFALPYWNWDHPKGMRLPPMFDRENTPLYDARRNPHVRNGTIIDFSSPRDEVTTDVGQTVTNNLTLMYRSMITNAACPLQFFGARYVLGDNDSKGQGTIENIPHTPVHIWAGTVRNTDLGGGKLSLGEDMGNFYSAALDPVFYCHHANVDRMWKVWNGLGGKRRDIIDTDWLNSEFFFYDENKNPYRVRVGDCLDTKKMGYDYAPAAIPWINCRPTRKGREGKVDVTNIKPANKVFPIANLNKPISFSINRPNTSRSQKDKDEKEEVLIFKGLKYDTSKYIRFDVFLNEDEDVNTDELDKVEFAGSYVNLPHVHAHNKKNDSDEMFQLGITELLEDIELEDDDTITVTVVPKTGGDVISIQSVAIELLDG